MYDNDSITELQYYGNLGLDISSSYYSDTDLDYTAGLAKASVSASDTTGSTDASDTADMEEGDADLVSAESSSDEYE